MNIWRKQWKKKNRLHLSQSGLGLFSADLAKRKTVFSPSLAGSAGTLIKLPSFQVAGPTRIGAYLPLIAWARVQQPLF